MELHSWKPREPRRLRTYERVAYQAHTCWNCHEPIRSGDFYRGEVFVGEFGLKVMKYHINPYCRDPWDEHDRHDFEDCEGEAHDGLEFSLGEAA